MLVDNFTHVDKISPFGVSRTTGQAPYLWDCQPLFQDSIDLPKGSYDIPCDGENVCPRKLLCTLKYYKCASILTMAFHVVWGISAAAVTNHTGMDNLRMLEIYFL